MGERRAAAGARKGMWRRTLGAASLPVAREAASLPEDLLHAVLDRPWPGAAEGVGLQSRGMDLPGLRHDGPPHVGDHGEEGVDGVGHVPPRRLGPRVGVREAAAAGIRPGGARAEDPGGTSTAGLGPQGPPWSRTRGH